MEGLELKKIKKIEEVISKKMNGQETVYFSSEELLKEPLLQNREGLEKILDLIQNGSNKKISWKIKKGQKFFRGSLTADGGGSPSGMRVVDTGIEIHVSDPDMLHEYLKEIILGMEKKEPKLNFKFSRKTRIMTIEDQNGKTYIIKIQGQIQVEVLNIIFRNPANPYEEWSLYDISEILGRHDTDEVSVKNALYQFDRKVQLTIPDVEKIFVLNKHSVRLSPIFKK